MNCGCYKEKLVYSYNRSDITLTEKVVDNILLTYGKIKTPDLVSIFENTSQIIDNKIYFIERGTYFISDNDTLDYVSSRSVDSILIGTNQERRYTIIAGTGKYLDSRGIVQLKTNSDGIRTLKIIVF